MYYIYRLIFLAHPYPENTNTLVYDIYIIAYIIMSAMSYLGEENLIDHSFTTIGI